MLREFINRERKNSPNKVKKEDIIDLFKIISSKLPSNAFYANLNLMLENIVLDIRSNWSLFVGDDMKRHTLPIKIKDDMLIIKCDHAIFAQHLQLLQNNLLKEINKHHSTSLKGFIVKIGSIQWQSETLKRKDIMSHDIRLVENPNIDNLVEKLKNITK